MSALTRRTLFSVTAAGALAAPLLMRRAAYAATPSAPALALPGAFKLGKYQIVVLSDGKIPFGKPEQTFGIDQSPDVVEKLLVENFLPRSNFINSFSPTLVDTGSQIILFDTGLGAAGREAGGGRLLSALQNTGYIADQITTVVLTHMHPDHIGGLMENGKPAFPNASYVAGQVEYDFWSSTARTGTAAEAVHKLVLSNVAPLAEKTKFIAGNAEIAPGITAIEAFGHSPGHMIFRVESEGKALILTADTSNHFVLSLQRPDWEVRFDMDKAKATATRKTVFDMLAADRLPFIGYHMPYPAVGFIEKLGPGYRFVPATYQFDL